MIPQTFIIKSIYIQNTIMLFSLGVVLFFLFCSLWRKKLKHVFVLSIWVLIVLWFFNSPFFGFSTVCVSTEGIRLNYGVLSSRNTVLPLDSSWKIETYLSGIRKMKKLYFIRIADHQSMKVRGGELSLLKEIGGAIDKRKHL
jgi:hypothetical protein